MPQPFNIPMKQLPKREQIAQRAYEIYLARGCQPGRDKDDWLQAEYELLQLPIHQIAILPSQNATRGKKKAATKAIHASALVMLVQGALLLGASSIR